LRRNLVGDEDAAAAVRCELDGFIEGGRRGDRVGAARGVVDRIRERRIAGQDRDRNAAGFAGVRVLGWRSSCCVPRPDSCFEDRKLAGTLDVVQIDNAYSRVPRASGSSGATLLTLRRWRYWPEGRPAVSQVSGLLDERGDGVVLRDVHAERARGETDADDERGENHAHGALDGAAIHFGGGGEHGGDSSLFCACPRYVDTRFPYCRGRANIPRAHEETAFSL